MTRKRTAPLTSDPPKRARCGPRSDVKQEAVPFWLHDAAAAFVNATPPLKWTGGFYSWGTWLDTLRNQSLWTSEPHTKTPWHQLVEACRISDHVRGTAALYRAKNDLVSAIISIVYRCGETLRLSDPEQKPAAERDIMRRIRAVVTRQRRHEAASITLIRYLDLAFVFSAYRDCRLAHASRETLAHANRDVEQELLFLQSKPSAKQTAAATQRMESYMWQHRWLPWYQQMPHMSNDLLISAREAAHAFCDGLHCPKFDVGTGVRGLSRDHLAGTGIMDEWLVTLFDEPVSPRWRRLAHVYESAVKDWRGEEGKLMEEISRRVIERILEPLTEISDGLDSDHCKLVDATPGIVVTQSAKKRGRFTFRLLVELNIHLIMFCEHLHARFHGKILPSIEDIHPAVLLFDELSRRVAQVRTHLEPDQAERLFASCLRAPDLHNAYTHPSAEALQNCKDYQTAAIKAALGPSRIASCTKSEEFPEVENVSESDPLMFAAIVAEWDPQLAARIIDAAVRIGKKKREEFLNGHECSLDLYTHRRTVVCDAAIDRCLGNRRAAAEIMNKLRPVWSVFEGDKGVGSFTRDGLLLLKVAVERGNFEAAVALGIFIGDEQWEDHRQACGVQRDYAAGIEYLCRAVLAGDVGASRDVIHLVCNQIAPMNGAPSLKGDSRCELVQKVRECLEIAARDVPAIALYLGYLHSVGAPGVESDCKFAMGYYKRVLQSNKVNTEFKAHAANNTAILKALHCDSIDCEDGITVAQYLRTAGIVGNPKADSNLAALMTANAAEEAELRKAAQMYERVFQANGKEVAVSVIQNSGGGTEMNVFELLVKNEMQEAFCRDLKSEGMDLQRYGRVLANETIAYSTKAVKAEAEKR